MYFYIYDTEDISKDCVEKTKFLHLLAIKLTVSETRQLFHAIHIVPDHKGRVSQDKIIYNRRTEIVNTSNAL